jgi:hypothetical protein
LCRREKDYTCIYNVGIIMAVNEFDPRRVVVYIFFFVFTLDVLPLFTRGKKSKKIAASSFLTYIIIELWPYMHVAIYTYSNITLHEKCDLFITSRTAVYLYYFCWNPIYVSLKKKSPNCCLQCILLYKLRS